MFWQNACQRRTGSARPHLIDLISAITDRRCSSMESFQFSPVRSLCCGVPQSSVLGQIMFLLYTADLGELAASLGLSPHDSQLYTSGFHRQLYSSAAEWMLVLSGY